MSEIVEVSATEEVASGELSIAFSPEELVVLARVLKVHLAIVGPAPLGAIAPSHRDDVLASAARSLRARNVLTGPTDLPAVDRAVAGLVQISARPALRAELVIDRGARLHRRYQCIPYASVEHEIGADGLHRLTPFATADLLARIMRHTDFVDRPVHDLEGFELTFGALEAVRAELASSGPAAARALLDDGDVPTASAACFIGALAEGRPVNAVHLASTVSPTRTEGGEVAWIDGGAAGLWQLPTLDQPFAALASASDDLDGERVDHDLAVAGMAGGDGLDTAVCRVEPIAASDLAAFLFGLLPSPSG